MKKWGCRESANVVPDSLPPRMAEEFVIVPNMNQTPRIIDTFTEREDKIVSSP
jgi:hypothetical protein